MCGDGWFNLCTLITQCATGVQPHPAPESNQTRPGEAASTRHHPHTPTIFDRFLVFPYGGISLPKIISNNDFTRVYN